MSEIRQNRSALRRILPVVPASARAMLVNLLLLALILIVLVVIGIMIWRLRKPPSQ
jgi:sensor domain CHASE-containing protein